VFRRWERRISLTDIDKQAMRDLPWSRRTYTRDAYLAREGETTTVCTLLVSGFAYRQKLVSKGARQIISFHIPGEFLDLQNSLLEVADHNVQALNRAVVATIPKDALQDLMATDANIRRALWLDSLIDSSIFREWVVNVGRRDSRTRIAHLLCEFALRLEVAELGQHTTYELPITQEQLADAVALTSVHVNRTLMKLEKDGLITRTKRIISIVDWKELIKVADFEPRYLHFEGPAGRSLERVTVS